jgi:hypothetical protein
VADVSGLIKTVRTTAERAVLNASRDMRDALTAAAPECTGELKRSIEDPVPVIFGDRIGVIMEAQAEHASFTNDGVQPFRIDKVVPMQLCPDGKQFRFIGLHPGITATHWWDDTVAQWGQFVQRALP